MLCKYTALHYTGARAHPSEGSVVEEGRVETRKPTFGSLRPDLSPQSATRQKDYGEVSSTKWHLFHLPGNGADSAEWEEEEEEGRWLHHLISQQTERGGGGGGGVGRRESNCVFRRVVTVRDPCGGGRPTTQDGENRTHHFTSE